MNKQFLALNEKTKLKDKDEISFPKSDVTLKINFILNKRDRSRSPTNENKHIKSEVVWNAVSFENKNKKDKFLRLMGAYKGKDPNSVKNLDTNKVDDKLSSELTENFKKIENDLTNQFYETIGRKYKAK